MVHPSELLRTNSDTASQFTAPLNSTHRNHIDCGITALPCLADRLNLERFAKPGVFLTFFSLLGLLLGALLSYFRGTAHIWMQHYTFSNEIIDWLLYMNEIFVGIFAFAITYWGDRIHRPSWLGALAIFQALACVVLIIPELHEPFISQTSNSTGMAFLCDRRRETRLTGLKEINYIALVVLFIYQMFYAFVTIAFYTLGITYLDDNINKETAIANLCVPMAAKMVGRQIGMHLSWIPILTENFLVFVTPVWLVMGALTFLTGIIITMFPKILPCLLMKHAVASLVNLASGNQGEDVMEAPKDGFFVTLLRLLKNPLLMVNIMAAVFMTTALVNFETFQNIFFQSRFFVSVGNDLSGYQDPFLAQIIINLLKQPFIATSIVATGLLIAKIRPRPMRLALWNVGIITLAALSFVSYAFLECDVRIQTERPGSVTLPFCSHDCHCDKNIPFSPVCPINSSTTFFSACHAGCSTFQMFNGIKIYQNCTCGENVRIKSNVEATEGSCNMDVCNIIWAYAQVSVVTSGVLLASGTIISLLINLRCVLPSDKAMALALETTLLGVLPYVPGKLVYSIIADIMCKYRGDNKCLFHNQSFGTFLSVTTVALMFISAIFAIVVVFLIRNINLYSDNEESETSEYEFREIEDNGSSLGGNNSARSNGNRRTFYDDEEEEEGEEMKRLMKDNLNLDEILDFRLKNADRNLQAPSESPVNQYRGDFSSVAARQRKPSNELLESTF